jgi:hypothetical protein
MLMANLLVFFFSFSYGTSVKLTESESLLYLDHSLPSHLTVDVILSVSDVTVDRFLELFIPSNHLTEFTTLDVTAKRPSMWTKLQVIASRENLIFRNIWSNVPVPLNFLKNSLHIIHLYIGDGYEFLDVKAMLQFSEKIEEIEVIACGKKSREIFDAIRDAKSSSIGRPFPRVVYCRVYDLCLLVDFETDFICSSATDCVLELCLTEEEFHPGVVVNSHETLQAISKADFIRVTKKETDDDSWPSDDDDESEEEDNSKALVSLEPQSAENDDTVEPFSFPPTPENLIPTNFLLSYPKNPTKLSLDRVPADLSTENWNHLLSLSLTGDSALESLTSLSFARIEQLFINDCEFDLSLYLHLPLKGSLKELRIQNCEKADLSQIDAFPELTIVECNTDSVVLPEVIPGRIVELRLKRPSEILGNLLSTEPLERLVISSPTIKIEFDPELYAEIVFEETVKDVERIFSEEETTSEISQKLTSLPESLKRLKISGGSYSIGTLPEVPVNVKVRYLVFSKDLTLPMRQVNEIFAAHPEMEYLEVLEKSNRRVFRRPTS